MREGELLFVLMLFDSLIRLPLTTFQLGCSHLVAIMLCSQLCGMPMLWLPVLELEQDTFEADNLGPSGSSKAN